MAIAAAKKKKKYTSTKVGRLLYKRSLTSKYSPGLGFKETMKMKVILFS